MILDALRQDAYLSRAFAKNPNWKPSSPVLEGSPTRTKEAEENKKDK